MMKPIKSENDYRVAMARIDALMDAELDTPEGDELDVLATLVDAYEAKTFLFNPPDPIEAIRFRMEQLGLERKDLEPVIGARGRVSEIFSRSRGLSLGMIRRLHEELQIPAESLIQEYPILQRGTEKGASTKA
jgi:HTH-type transcriptional regulator / antitoxin HigA